MPGIVRPLVVTALESGLEREAPVIGIIAGGRARAYVLSALAPIDHHVVNDLIADVPVTITFCDRTNCVRAFTSSESKEPLPLKLGGFQDGMLLQLAGKMYKQESQEAVGSKSPFPYHRLPHEETTWGKWVAEHPDSEVFTGD